jgi:hypothetical protein
MQVCKSHWAGRLSASCPELPGVCAEVSFWAATPMQLATHSAITVNLFTFVISSLFYGFTLANVVGGERGLQK